MKRLSKKVEQSLISKIREQEDVAANKGHQICCDDYLSLANLYEMEGDYEQQFKVLERFLNFNALDDTDKKLVEAQYIRAKALRHAKRLKHRHEKKSQLTDGSVLSSGSQKLKPFEENNSNIATGLKEPLSVRKFVIVCAAYTGKTVHDEIFELALVGIDYCENNDVVIGVTHKYEGQRLPQKKIPAQMRHRYSASQALLKKNKLDKERVAHILSGTDGVISHNDPFIERQHLITLFPEFADKPWYSSQLDIPWEVFGVTSHALSDLLESYQLSSKIDTLLGRAMGIMKLLAQVEPKSGKTFFNKLMLSQPMKPFQWTEALENHSKKINKKAFKIPFFG